MYISRDLGGKPVEVSETITAPPVWWPPWLPPRLLWPAWMAAFRLTFGVIGVGSDPLLPLSFTLSRFDSPGTLNCSVNLDAASSSLTYWSCGTVL